MKLIYIANARIPTERAHGIQIIKMLEAFALTGAVVELIIPRRLNHISADPFEYYKVKRIFKITKLPCLDLTTLIRGRFIFLVQTITFLISARVYLFFKKYNILYVREQFSGLFFKNFVLELHTMPQKISYIHKKLWGGARVFVVLTSYIKKRLEDLGIKEDKILVAPDGVDLEQFTVSKTREFYREKFGLPINKMIVLYTGQLYNWKGVHILAEAAKVIKSAQFVFVGGNEVHASDFARPYKDLDNVTVLGQKPHSDMPFIMSCADVLILPNSGKEDISRLYTSPLKLFEYMASCRPIIVSDLPSVREILDEETAYFFEPDDPKSLAKTIERALANTEEALMKAKKSLAKVRKYTWEMRTRKILDSIFHGK